MGWIGNALTIIGIWQTGHKKRSGFLITAVGCLCWLIVGFQTQKPDLIFIEVVLTIFLVCNWHKWRKTDG
jgi:hypothetical protein